MICKNQFTRSGLPVACWEGMIQCVVIIRNHYAVTSFMDWNWSPTFFGIFIVNRVNLVDQLRSGFPSRALI